MTETTIDEGFLLNQIKEKLLSIHQTHHPPFNHQYKSPEHTLESNANLQQLTIQLTKYESDLQIEFESLNQKISQSQNKIKNLIQFTTNTARELKSETDTIHQAYLNSEEELIDRCQPNQLNIQLTEKLEWLKQLSQLKLWFKLLSLIQDKSKQIGSIDEFKSINEIIEELFALLKLYQNLISNNLNGLIKDQFHLFNLIQKIIIQTIQTLVNLFSKNLIEVLEEEFQWPQTIGKSIEQSPKLLKSFKDICDFQHELENLKGLIETSVTKPINHNVLWFPINGLLVIKALIKPIELRFRYHFDSNRSTNRLDKPEWYFDHIIQRLSDHQEFVRKDIQKLLNLNNYKSINAMEEFSKGLLEMVEKKLKQTIPEILNLKPILAHTIQKSLDFDQSIRDLGFLNDNKWLGTVEVILGNQSWFNCWFEAELKYFKELGDEIMNEKDNFEIEDDDMRTITKGIKTTKASIKVQDLIESISKKIIERLSKLEYKIKFLIEFQIELIKSFIIKLESVLISFENRLSLLRSIESEPGLIKLAKINISARWFDIVLENWNDELFYLELYEELKQQSNSINCSENLKILSNKLSKEIGTANDNKNDNLFENFINRFKNIQNKSEGLLSKHLISVIQFELKPYVSKRWDLEGEGEEEQEVEAISIELINPLIIYKKLLKRLLNILGKSKCIKLYKQINYEIENFLITKIIGNSDYNLLKSISFLGGKQLLFDLKFGFLNLYNEEEEEREREMMMKFKFSWKKWFEICNLLSLPKQNHHHQNDLTISKAIEICFNSDNDFKMLKDFKNQFNIHHLSFDEIKLVLKRRPECWK
ncbi:hypothetical protein CROQUDRAFT_662996 [Cronartium quercuum f. sp. fusiforme G11]|uniref:Uncharacterized protein n=1 Tax=Cronartium quercuum f. sp. fusiforme G11 TaxID=708437 RepID=A0A9P6T7H5_9BASI|nr:hypothetical protein CROQUDRAFT_662996 [Cronartium quercuum f. sp. fusiforme G11]